jgi:AraC-like DNA-binding protein
MKYFTIAPPDHLKGFVRSFWVLEHEVNTATPYIHRTLADGSAELVFHYKGRFDELIQGDKTTPSFVSGLHGQSQNFRRFIIDEGFGIFGVYLYPYAIPALLGIPADEVSDQMPDLETLLGKEGAELEERMMLAPNHDARTEIIVEFLSMRLIRAVKPEPGVFKAIQHVIQNQGLSRVSDLAEQSCLSSRQFERKFKAFSGISPKLAVRINRFQAALSTYADKNKSLTEIAYASGYYDQSHFIRDFKIFSGQHPRFYFSGRGEGSDFRDA